MRMRVINKGGSVEHPWRRGHNILNQDLLLWHFSLVNSTYGQKIHGFNCIWQTFLPSDLSGLRYLDFWTSQMNGSSVIMCVCLPCPGLSPQLCRIWALEQPSWTVYGWGRLADLVECWCTWQCNGSWQLREDEPELCAEVITKNCSFQHQKAQSIHRSKNSCRKAYIQFLRFPPNS